jgi:hypothetical protein
VKIEKSVNGRPKALSYFMLSGFGSQKGTGKFSSALSIGNIFTFDKLFYPEFSYFFLLNTFNVHLKACYQSN